MQKAAYAYLATQVTTTDQGDLLLLLYEGAIKFLKQAKAKIEERDYAQKGMLISKALDVIAELDGSLNVEKGGELAQNLHNLYFYCNTRLLQANLRMNIGQIDEVIRILESLKEAFQQISKSKFQTKAATVHAPSAEDSADGAPAGKPGKSNVFSIGKGSGGPAPAAHVLAATAQSAPAAPAYRPPQTSPAAATRTTPVAALRKPAPDATDTTAAPETPAAPQAPAAPQSAPQAAPAPQPEAEANPELARVKALHRAYGRYGSS